MSITRSLAATVVAVLLWAPLPAQTQVIQPTKAEKTTETRTVPLAAGSTLKVKNVNGFIHVEAWDREEVQFTGEFKPSSRDEQVKVVIESGKNSLEIRGEYPKHEGWGSYQGPLCQMTLKVPRKVTPFLQTVNGEVTLSGTQGAADLTTVNGSVRATELAEALKVTTVNGAITLAQVHGELTLETVNGTIKGTDLDSRGQALRAATVNGSIHLQTTGLKGRLKANTVHGDITFNAKGAEQVEVKKHSVMAVFPGGDRDIELKTVNGGITLN